MDQFVLMQGLLDDVDNVDEIARRSEATVFRIRAKLDYIINSSNGTDGNPRRCPSAPLWNRRSSVSNCHIGPVTTTSRVYTWNKAQPTTTFTGFSCGEAFGIMIIQLIVNRRPQLRIGRRSQVTEVSLDMLNIMMTTRSLKVMNTI